MTSPWLFCLLAPAVAEAAQPLDLAQVAIRFDRLSHRFDNCRITIRQWSIRGDHRLPSTEAELVTDGRNWRQTYIHFGPRVQTPDEARKYDNRVNYVIYDGKQRLEFWEKTRSATLHAVPALPSTGLDLAEHLTKTFTTSALLRPHLDRPLDIYSPDHPGLYRCTWRDLMLPEALRQPGWASITAQSASAHGRLHLRRQIAPGFTDDLWLDPKRGYAVSHREISFLSNQRIVFDYDDIVCVGDDMWLPSTCRWRGRDGFAVEQKIIDLQFGRVRVQDFAFTLPEGTKVYDARNGTTKYLPGGDVVLTDLVARARYLYALPRRASAPKTRLETLVRVIATVMPLCAILWFTRHTRFNLPRRFNRSRSSGLTLIETLVVVSVIGVLIALLLPAAQSAREAARRAQCQNNLKQIGLAIHQYESVYAQLPTGRLNNGIEVMEYCRSVFVALLPYLDQTPLYNQVNFSLWTTDVANLTVDVSRPGVFLCPSDPEAANVVSAGPNSRYPYNDPPGGTYPTALTNYGMMYGTVRFPWETRTNSSYDPLGEMNGCFNDLPSIRLSGITDGLSNTAFGGERAVGFMNRGRVTPIFGTWTLDIGQSTLFFATFAPNDVFKNPFPPNVVGPTATALSSFHAGGVNLLFGDGRVEFIKETVSSWPIDPIAGKPAGSMTTADGLVNLPHNGVWQAMTTRAGGEIIQSKD